MSSEVTGQRQPNGSVESYLQAPYVRMLVPDAEDGTFIAEVLELPGCLSSGRSPAEAYENLQDAMKGWIAASRKNNKPIPEPVGDREFSGHFALRMAPSLHRAAALRSAYEGVSLNQWIIGAIVAQVTRQDLADQVADKVVARVADEFASRLKVLSP